MVPRFYEKIQQHAAENVEYVTVYEEKAKPMIKIIIFVWSQKSKYYYY